MRRVPIPAQHYGPICRQCRQYCANRIAQEIWVQAGPLTAVEYLCEDCEYVAGLLGLSERV